MFRNKIERAAIRHRQWRTAEKIRRSAETSPHPPADVTLRYLSLHWNGDPQRLLELTKGVSITEIFTALDQAKNPTPRLDKSMLSMIAWALLGNKPVHSQFPHELFSATFWASLGSICGQTDLQPAQVVSSLAELRSARSLEVRFLQTLIPFFLYFPNDTIQLLQILNHQYAFAEIYAPQQKQLVDSLLTSGMRHVAVPAGHLLAQVRGTLEFSAANRKADEALTTSWWRVQLSSLFSLLESKWTRSLSNQPNQFMSEPSGRYDKKAYMRYQAEVINRLFLHLAVLGLMETIEILRTESPHGFSLNALLSDNNNSTVIEPLIQMLTTSLAQRLVFPFPNVMNTEGYGENIVCRPQHGYIGGHDSTKWNAQLIASLPPTIQQEVARRLTQSVQSLVNTAGTAPHGYYSSKPGEANPDSAQAALEATQTSNRVDPSLVAVLSQLKENPPRYQPPPRPTW